MIGFADTLLGVCARIPPLPMFLGRETERSQLVPAAEFIRAAPGLVRIVGGTWLRTGMTVVETSFRIANRVLEGAASGESTGRVLSAGEAELRRAARRLLEVGDERHDTDAPAAGADSTAASLMARGAELLRQSADVHLEDGAHPAYARILTEMAPDEARILRLLAAEGPQPSVDVRRASPLHLLASRLTAQGLSMLAREAGCKRPERLRAYLNNLNRLGLVWFPHDPVEDRLRYQVLESQPEVAEALAEGPHSRTVRRSIALTPFGEDFCHVCLPEQ